MTQGESELACMVVPIVRPCAEIIKPSAGAVAEGLEWSRGFGSLDCPDIGTSAVEVLHVYRAFKCRTTVHNDRQRKDKGEDAQKISHEFMVAGGDSGFGFSTDVCHSRFLACGPDSSAVTYSCVEDYGPDCVNHNVRAFKLDIVACIRHQLMSAMR